MTEIPSIEGCSDEQLRQVINQTQAELNARAMASPSLRAASPGTCPRRMDELGPWPRKEGLDGFTAEAVCVFCGSISVEAFEGFIREAAKPKSKVRIDSAKGGAKFYVRNPDARGCVKFYAVHATREQRESHYELLRDALHVSRVKAFGVTPEAAAQEFAAALRPHPDCSNRGLVLAPTFRQAEALASLLPGEWKRNNAGSWTGPRGEEVRVLSSHEASAWRGMTAAVIWVADGHFIPRSAVEAVLSSASQQDPLSRVIWSLR